MVLAHGHQCSTVDPDDRVREDALGSPHGEICFNLAKSTFADVPFSGGDMSAVNSMFLAVSSWHIAFVDLLDTKSAESSSGSSINKGCTKLMRCWERQQG
jgi:hypothetical protein